MRRCRNAPLLYGANMRNTRKIEDIRKKWQFRMDAEKWEEDLHPRDENGQFASKDSHKEKKEDKPEKSKFEGDRTEDVRDWFDYCAGRTISSYYRMLLADRLGNEKECEKHGEEWHGHAKERKELAGELVSRGVFKDLYGEYSDYEYECSREVVGECEVAIEDLLIESEDTKDQKKLLEALEKVRAVRELQYDLESNQVKNGYLKGSENISPYDERDYYDSTEDELKYEKEKCEHNISWVISDCKNYAKNGELRADQIESASDYIKSMYDNMCVIDGVLAERSKPVQKPKYNHAVTTKPKYNNDAMKKYAESVNMPKVERGIPSLQKWQTRASKYINNRTGADGTLWGLNTEELVNLKNNFQKIVDNAELCTNFNSEILDNIIVGRFKNQFETGTTGGSDDLNARAKMADNIFGLPMSAKGVDREKFGYLADKHDYKRTLSSWGPSYGIDGSGELCMATFRKDKVANRTTYTFDDSLVAATDSGNYSFAAGMIDGDVSIEGISYDYRKAKSIADGTAKSVEDLVSYGYIECQYHGIVTIEDVESFRFKKETDMYNAIKGLSDTAKELLKKHKVQLGYFDDDHKLRLHDSEDIL